MTTIGLSLDNVLADTDQHWIETHLSHFGFGPRAGGFRTSLALPTLEHVDRWTASLGPKWWRSIPPCPAAMGAVWTLLDEGHRIEVLTQRTHRNRDIRQATQDWLADNWPVGHKVPAIHHVERSYGAIDCGIYVVGTWAEYQPLAEARAVVVPFRLTDVEPGKRKGLKLPWHQISSWASFGNELLEMARWTPAERDAAITEAYGEGAVAPSDRQPTMARRSFGVVNKR